MLQIGDSSSTDDDGSDVHMFKPGDFAMVEVPCSDGRSTKPYLALVIILYFEV